MSIKNKLLAVFITTGTIVVVSKYIIRSINKTLKKINLNEIYWDI